MQWVAGHVFIMRTIPRFSALVKHPLNLSLVIAQETPYTDSLSQGIFRLLSSPMLTLSKVVTKTWSIVYKIIENVSFGIISSQYALIENTHLFKYALFEISTSWNEHLLKYALFIIRTISNTHYLKCALINYEHFELRTY